MKYTIRQDETINSWIERKKLYAVDGRGKIIFGANAEVRREKNFNAEKFGKWIVSWGSVSSDTMERKEIEFAVIKKAMELVRKLNERFE